MPARYPSPIGPGPALSPRRQLQPDPLLELSATCTYSVPLLSCSWLTSLVFYGMRFAQPSPPTRFSRLPRSVGSLPVCLPVRGAACILIKGFCSPFVFMVLQIAFPATPLYSQRSALPPGGPLLAHSTSDLANVPRAKSLRSGLPPPERAGGTDLTSAHRHFMLWRRHLQERSCWFAILFFGFLPSAASPTPSRAAV